MGLRKILGAVWTPKATLFHWNFVYGHLNVVFGLESGCIKLWWYPDLMSSIIKYCAAFNLDQMWPIFMFLIKAKLPFDFTWVICTLGICLFSSWYSITNLLVSAEGAPGLHLPCLPMQLSRVLDLCKSSLTENGD